MVGSLEAAVPPSPMDKDAYDVLSVRLRAVPAGEWENRFDERFKRRIDRTNMPKLDTIAYSNRLVETFALDYVVILDGEEVTLHALGEVDWQVTNGFADTLYGQRTYDYSLITSAGVYSGPEVEALFDEIHKKVASQPRG